MELTESEKNDLKQILVHIFGQEANSWPMNEGTLSATGEMLAAMKSCSKAMDYVPRPVGFKPDLSYLRRQLRDMARRAQNHDNMYEVCRTVGKWQWRTEIVTRGTSR